MDASAIIALITAIVALIFAALLARQYIQRKRPHQLLWAASMVLFALTSLIEFSMDPNVLGPNISIFRIYFIAAATLVGLLGAGTVYLLAHKRFAQFFLGVIIILSLGLLITGLLAPIDSTVFNDSFAISLVNGIANASASYPFYVQIFAMLLDIVGSIFLIGGALYSFVRDRSRMYNLLIAAGGALPALGGALLGIFNDPSVFFESTLAGIILLFIGFLLSTSRLTKRGRTPQTQAQV
jgi:hypothetical protein